MPTYEYECNKCGTVFELFQPITEPARKKLKKGDPKPCKCNAAVTRRIGTGGGLIFKGSGFYITDYRSDGYKKAASADSGESSKSKDTTSKSEPAATKAESSTAPAKESSSKSDKPAVKKSSKKSAAD
jgi:putative FmdB family regulatory protein